MQAQLTIPTFGDARLPARFWAKVRVLPNGCWEWMASKQTVGYGQFSVGPHMMALAHRVAYETLVGAIPEGLQSDHLCRNRICVYPAHIELVTSHENTLRGNSPPALHARQTHCLNGHPFDEVNTHRLPDGERQCRAC